MILEWVEECNIYLKIFQKDMTVICLVTRKQRLERIALQKSIKL